MASAKLRKKAATETFLSPEQTRTIKPADFKNHLKFKDLSQDDLIELLCLMEAELQAKDVLLKAILCGTAGVALPLSHLLNDLDSVSIEADKPVYGTDEDDEVWLGEPSAHLSHVVAYHQVVREQMTSIVKSLQHQHGHVVDQLENERHKHVVDTAQGDDVTYMLEKERERLHHQIELEQAKYAKLETERDALLKVIETERRDQYNTFNNLMNDCKAFALQLVEQTSKYEHYKKEIDKEKQKNKLLSELMVEETRKFKEKLKLYEDEVNDFHVLEQKRNDLETKLRESEAQCKNMFHELNEERKDNGKLRYQLNQVRKQLPNFDNEFTDSGDDALQVPDHIEVSFKQARTSTIQLSNEQERDSPEPTTILPPAVQLQPGKVATVQKSSSVKQNSKVVIPRVKPGVVVSVNNGIHSPKLNSNSQKRYSYEEQQNGYDFDNNDESQKRNSFESVINQPYEGGHTAHVRTTNSVKQKRNSYEEVRNIGSPSATPKRNSYEGDSRRFPPPAPPRRVSSLDTPEKAPIVKIPQQLQPRKSTHNSQSNNLSYIHSRNSTTTDVPVMLLLSSKHGCKYNKDYGIIEINDVLDFISIIHVNCYCSWEELTRMVDHTLLKDCLVTLNDEQDFHDSILSYECSNVTWSKDNYPEVTVSDVISEKTETITIRLKGVVDNCFDDLAYSLMMSIQTVEEFVRMIYQEGKLLFTVNEEMEGKYFVACLSHWIKMHEETFDNPCTIINVESNENKEIFNLTNLLLNHGVLQRSERRKLKEKFVLILNINHMDNEGFTSVIFDWLSNSPNKKYSYNGYSTDEENYYLDEDVFVLAYATNNSISSLSQWTYRLFETVPLAPSLPGLMHRWLQQKVIEYSPQLVLDLYIVDTTRWLLNVYQSLRKSFLKIDLIHKLPDISVYLDAPIADNKALFGWIEELWTESVMPCVEESVMQRTSAATSQQQELLIKATLKAIFEQSIKTGCPIDFNF